LKQVFSKIASSGGVTANLRSFVRFMEHRGGAEESSSSDFSTLIRRIKVQLHDKFGSNSNTMHQLKFNCDDVVGTSRTAMSRASKRDFLTIMTNIKVGYDSRCYTAVIVSDYCYLSVDLCACRLIALLGMTWT
jgi:hypothetical protein